MSEESMKQSRLPLLLLIIGLITLGAGITLLILGLLAIIPFAWALTDTMMWVTFFLIGISVVIILLWLMMKRKKCVCPA